LHFRNRRLWKYDPVNPAQLAARFLEERFHDGGNILVQSRFVSEKAELLWQVVGLLSCSIINSLTITSNGQGTISKFRESSWIKGVGNQRGTTSTGSHKER
jgi:hypothetical protein